MMLCVDKPALQCHMEKLQSKMHLRLTLDEEALRWTPVLSSNTVEQEEAEAEMQVSGRC